MKGNIIIEKSENLEKSQKTEAKCNVITKFVLKNLPSFRKLVVTDKAEEYEGYQRATESSMIKKKFLN
ncbi:hypothetical protein O9G_003756 [Rozella allomycis CSF55]|uniref:Uncharacterized protein n=1 Tax=Rozella allomycis (strain CSF55) TaxID=988480 RepID=A0A075AUS7_ROZAC|nr:hypothetical protein O9G_003756 [Rozella allomycis CSF55]|eukprot:EPZ34036.1 hypothetical protein O9G_003756 [Rozella allomycis CSF55]